MFVSNLELAVVSSESVEVASRPSCYGSRLLPLLLVYSQVFDNAKWLGPTPDTRAYEVRAPSTSCATRASGGNTPCIDAHEPGPTGPPAGANVQICLLRINPSELQPKVLAVSSRGPVLSQPVHQQLGVSLELQ